MSTTRESYPHRSWIRWLFIILLVLPTSLLLIGFFYETIASRSDDTRFPPPGKLVDVGGYKMHIHCTGERGENQPLVVIEAGAGSASQDWVLVQPEINKTTRVCSYDRAGMAWSEASPAPRDSAYYASELATLLEKSNEEPPYLLVAHSLGAHTARIFASEHPDSVSGLVLVDSRISTGEIPSGAMSDTSLRLWSFLARCGFFRLIGNKVLTLQAPEMVEKIPDYPIPIVYDPIFFETSIQESAVIENSDHQAEGSGSFGDMPLVVIAHELPGLFSYLPPHEEAEAEDIFRARQLDLLDLSTNSTFLIAEGSGHNVPIDNPGVIVQAVEIIFDQLTPVD
jgi:pimeloyl-ACP methyl ester carboxylesterase